MMACYNGIPAMQATMREDSAPPNMVSRPSRYKSERRCVS